jgi:hypothetical protein
MVGGLGLIILFNLNRSIWSTQLITQYLERGRHGCDRMVVGFTTTYAISAYHH